MNFGLCRILLATINGNVSTGATFTLPFLPNWNDVAWDYTTIQAYAKYVRDHVFAPAGVAGPEPRSQRRPTRWPTTSRSTGTAGTRATSPR